jgi:serine protease Do
MRGEVIGVNSQIATSTGDYNGIGFALPSNEVGNVYRQILRNGKVRRGYLGVLLDSVKTEFAKVYGLPEAKGAIITEVRDKKSAAANAGLLANDVILEFNGETVENAQDLIQKVAGTQPDQLVNVTFLRENGNDLERRTTAIKLDERPSNNRVVDNEKPRKLPLDDVKKPLQPFGLTLTELTDDTAKLYRLEGEKGLIVKKINPASFIADVKSSTGGDALSEGDLIQRINRKTVTDLKSFNETAAKLKKGDAVVLHVLSYNRFSQSTQMRVVQFTIQ